MHAKCLVCRAGEVELVEYRVGLDVRLPRIGNQAIRFRIADDSFNQSRQTRNSRKRVSVLGHIISRWVIRLFGLSDLLFA